MRHRASNSLSLVAGRPELRASLAAPRIRFRLRYHSAVRSHLPDCIFIFAGLLVLGCSSSMVLPEGNPADYATPSVAVMKFDNQAGSFMSWDLGTGMRDILVDRLVATKRFRVIERPELNAVLSEIRFQSSGLTREQQKVAPRQVKNVQYLIKGTITDFGQVQRTNIFGGTSDLGIFGGQQRAVMGMILYVVDVESGEIIASESLQESVYAGSVSASARYKGVALGGSAFNQTPLGEATANVISRAIAKVTAVASRPDARIAAINRTERLSSAGADFLTAGWTCDVRRWRTLKKPETGDVRLWWTALPSTSCASSRSGPLQRRRARVRTRVGVGMECRSSPKG
jgi:curli biogenesis system outer membrane secretion channel CsgG